MRSLIPAAAGAPRRLFLLSPRVSEGPFRAGKFTAEPHTCARGAALLPSAPRPQARRKEPRLQQAHDCCSARCLPGPHCRMGPRLGTPGQCCGPSGVGGCRSPPSKQGGIGGWVRLIHGTGLDGSVGLPSSQVQAGSPARVGAGTPASPATCAGPGALQAGAGGTGLLRSPWSKGGPRRQVPSPVPQVLRPSASGCCSRSPLSWSGWVLPAHRASHGW